MASDSRLFTCNTCATAFDTSELQRSHMRGSWHVYNVKRRVTQMPVLSQEQFNAQVPQDAHLNSKKDRQDDVLKAAMVESDPEIDEEEDEVGEKLSPLECLFCNLDSSTINENVQHMQSVHGLYIPEPDQLTDMETFLGYLASIFTHMRDKGHCMINLEAESELLDFWEISQDDEDQEETSQNKNLASASVHVSATELRLPSGSIITSRSDTAQVRAKPMLTKYRVKASQMRTKREEMKAITDGSETKKPKAPDSNMSMRTQPGTDLRVAIRGEMGLVGLSEQQNRALMATEAKMKKREHIAKAAQRWATEKVANKQKFFKPDVPGRKNG
ncbi:hypothetical protein DM02DRAFT_654522 [Periconia macrospinosa]|uniref:C2H2-type domain-containing protein n=1 Tax=Periconia macrospinosa TaxID=97972 RepID=A0A2V1DVT1_9PLEO|nr:hypothetical protein DM02DRAFT_654522 [Periconia macrospinosa]